MNCQFSETQFSFCLTFEYINKFFPNIPLPIFPNIVEEGRIGGYDVAINSNLFFQFKIPQYFTKPSFKTSHFWEVYRDSYYKIKVDTNKKQFQLLKELKVNDYSNEVYYVTPEFHNTAQLTKHYQVYQISNNSAFFSIDEFPAYKSGHHHLIYNTNSESAMLFSEPIEIKKIKGLKIENLFNNEKNQSLYSTAKKIDMIINSLDNEGLLDDRKSNYIEEIYEDESSFIKRIHNILLTQYNILWLPVL